MEFLDYLAREHDFNLKNEKKEYEELKNTISQLKIGDTVYYWEGGEDIYELKVAKINYKTWMITITGWNPLYIGQLSLKHPLSNCR